MAVKRASHVRFRARTRARQAGDRFRSGAGVRHSECIGCYEVMWDSTVGR